jgi:hypothetical protein
MEYKTLYLDDGTSKQIPFKNGFINANKLCELVSKRVDNWLRSSETKNYINLLTKKLNLSREDIIIIKRGGNCKEQGTWLHDKLALYFCIWCSKSFFIQITDWIDEWRSLNEKNQNKYYLELYNLQPDDNLIYQKEKEIKLKLQKELGGEIEKETESGFIDLLTDTQIIEIKNGINWKYAVGQILMYSIDFPNHQKRIHLFDMDRDIKIEQKCGLYSIVVTYE